ncbi:hypothetical protein GQ457_13G020780 [Hibiscus cannabinus]
MGFSKKWCSWIRTCISTATLFILVNGSPTDSFSIKRDLRQGCPLSPILFNIVAEALSSMMSKDVSLGYFNGNQIGTNMEAISHIQFANDLIVFAGANESEIRNIIRLLRGFELVSGLKLNLKKIKINWNHCAKLVNRQLGESSLLQKGRPSLHVPGIAFGSLSECQPFMVSNCRQG